jgi:prepilin peptidase CpaA
MRMSATAEHESSAVSFEKKSLATESRDAVATPRFSREVSASVGVLIAACILILAYWMRLPLLIGAAFFLLFAVNSDLLTSRIPNWLNGLGLLGALSCSLILAGWAGLGTSILGAGSALAVGFVFYALGLLGAGDAKAMMVLGAFLGLNAVPALYFWMLLAGGLLSLMLLAKRGEISAYFARWLTIIHSSFSSHRLAYSPPRAGSAASGGVPFAVCMGLGVMAHAILGAPW